MEIRNSSSSQGSEKPGFFKMPNPLCFMDFIGFWILYGLWDFFIWTSSWEACWLIYSSAELLFRFTSTLDYLKICKFITSWSLEAVNIKKPLSLVQDFCWVFSVGFWVLPRCLNPGSNTVYDILRSLWFHSHRSHPIACCCVSCCR